MFHYRSEALVNQSLRTGGPHAYRHDAGDERHGRETLVPVRIVQLQVVGILHRTVEYLADRTQDIDGRHHDGGRRQYRQYAAQQVGMFERTDENGHFGHEPAESRQAERSETGYHVTNRCEGHDTHQAAHLADVARVGAAVNDAYQRKEQGRHQAVRKHLKHRAGHGRPVKHQNGEEHEAAVAHRRIGVHVLQVGLHHRAVGAVYHPDTGKDKEYPRQLLRRLRHQEYRHTETAVAAQLHQYAGMQHRDRSRRRGMAVGRPRMERKERSEHSETDECQAEYPILMIHGNTELRNLHDIHRGRPGGEVDAENPRQQEGRTAHEHQRQLRGGIDLLSGTPYPYQQKHRDEGYLVEHEHREEVERDEIAENAHRQQAVPHEEIALHVPRREDARKGHDGRKQQHHHRDTVHTHRIMDIERRIPYGVAAKQHRLVRHRPLLQEHDRYHHRAHQLQSEPRRDHRAHEPLPLSREKREQGEQRYDNQ